MDTNMYAHLAARRLARLVKLSRFLNSVSDLDEMLGFILNEAVALTDAEAASILLVDPQTKELRFRATSHGAGRRLIDVPVPIDSSIAGAVLKADEPILIADVLFDSRWNSDLDDAIAFKTRSILGVPMRDGARPIGVLEALNKREGTFTDDDLELLTILAELAGVAIERTRLVRALKVANQQLSQLDELKSNFIAIASHELHTPLSIILGYASFLRESADPDLAEQIDHVLEAAVRLRSLIQDMLNLRYIETGNLQLKTDYVDLVNLVRTYVTERDETAIAKSQMIYANLPAAPAYVRADSNMLEIVISNLLSNAVKFTPEGGRINIDLSQRPQEVWVCIRDTGVGIPPEQLEHIFDRFYQVEQPLTRSYDGLGVGLSIAKELVELHGGRIWATSKPGVGSAFNVALPLATPPP